MLLYLLEFIHSSFEAASILAGLITLSKIFAGRPFEQWAIFALQSALIVSVIGMLFPVGRLLSVRLAAMITVYVAGMATLAWRQFHLTRTWGLVFALSLIGVLCLEVIVAIRNLFYWVSPTDTPGPQPVKLSLLIAESVAVLFFLGLCVSAVRRYQNRSVDRL